MNNVFMKGVLEIAVRLSAVKAPDIGFVVREKPFVRFLNEELEFAHIPMR